MKKLYLLTATIGYGISITLCFFDLPIQMLWLYMIYPICIIAVGCVSDLIRKWSPGTLGLTFFPCFIFMTLSAFLPSEVGLTVALKGFAFSLTTSVIILEKQSVSIQTQERCPDDGKGIYICTAVIGYGISVALCFTQVHNAIFALYIIIHIIFMVAIAKDHPNLSRSEITGIKADVYTMSLFLILYSCMLFSSSSVSVDSLLEFLKKGGFFALTTSSIILEKHLVKYYG